MKHVANISTHLDLATSVPWVWVWTDINCSFDGTGAPTYAVGWGRIARAEDATTQHPEDVGVVGKAISWTSTPSPNDGHQ